MNGRASAATPAAAVVAAAASAKAGSVAAALSAAAADSFPSKPQLPLQLFLQLSADSDPATFVAFATRATPTPLFVAAVAFSPAFVAASTAD